MPGPLELDAEEFRQAALEFTPVSVAVSESSSAARTDSAAFSSADWGDDELGQQFFKDYDPGRTNVLDSGDLNAKAFGEYKTTFVNVHSGYTTTDENNGEKFEGIHNGQVRQGDQTYDVGADGALTSKPKGSTANTTDDVANQLNELNDLERRSREDWRRNNR